MKQTSGRQEKPLSREFDPYGRVPPDVDLRDLKTWILFEDHDLLVVDKPGWLVCHPSKRGPRSSLIGAAREYIGAETLHLVARLDRETSGVVVLAKNRESARKYQTAVEHRHVRKEYFAILNGELTESVRVDKPIGKCTTSAVHSKMEVSPDSDRKDAVTLFSPIEKRNGFTTCNIETETGRRHQIRVHAQSIGHSVVADKLYGQDETFFVEFIHHGWTELHNASLPIKRQALHCTRYAFEFDGHTQEFVAPIPDDIEAFCVEHMKITPYVE